MDEAIKTKSVCPECGMVIGASLVRRDSSIMMEKDCPIHGHFEERCYGAEQFGRLGKYFEMLHSLKKPEKASDLPNCGPCREHFTKTILGLIDVTNRCNLNCSYCFANARKCGYLYEPSISQIRGMLKLLRGQDPPCTAVLFSGGEPTMRDDLPEIIGIASDMKFDTLVATNGYRIARDLEYVKRLVKARLSIVYLSFDGFTEKSNPEKKNHLIIDKILKNCREAGNLGIVLVPAAIKGRNGDEAFKFVQFAIKNSDVIRGVNFQPISFCGKMDPEKRKEMRYLVSDLIDDLERQSGGLLKKGDFYPIPVTVPLSKFVEAVEGKNAVTFSVNPFCGSATYLFTDNDGNTVPLTRFLDVEKFNGCLEKYAGEIRGKNIAEKALLIGKAMKDAISCVDKDRVPKGLDIASIIFNVLSTRGDMPALNDFHHRMTFVGSMHFQDKYNMDFERVKYCGIHYVTPDLSKIPFCTYNNFDYREKTERRFSTPLDSR